MPFTSKYLSSDEIDAIYNETKKYIERQQLVVWCQRVADPACELSASSFDRALEALENDHKATIEMRTKGGEQPPGDT